MKKTLLALAAAGLVSTGASATVLTFDDGLAGGGASSFIDFNEIDLNSDTASVTQTDDGNGTVAGSDSFIEFGSTFATNFLLDSVDQGNVDIDYELWFDYNFGGNAVGQPNLFGFSDLFIQVLFNTGTAGLYLDSNVNNVNDGGTQLLSYSLNSGTCNLFGDIGSGSVIDLVGFGVCDISMDVTVLEAGYFFSDNVDLSGYAGTITSTMAVTVQELNGLYFSYGAQEGVAGDGIEQQLFSIKHDGNIITEIPEPGSLALFAVGLLGAAGIARRKKA